MHAKVTENPISISPLICALTGVVFFPNVIITIFLAHSTCSKMARGHTQRFKFKNFCYQYLVTITFLVHAKVPPDPPIFDLRGQTYPELDMSTSIQSLEPHSSLTGKLFCTFIGKC